MFDFDGRAVTSAEEMYRAITMEPRQEALVKEIASFIAPQVGLDPIPCRGFLLMAVRRWQIEHETTVDVLAQKPPKERAANAREIANGLAAILRQHLRDPARREQLDEVVAKGFQLYLEKYNRRPPA